MAAEALRRIGLLYAAESDVADPESRLQRRQEHAKPQLVEMHAWLRATLPQVAPSSGTAKAIDYALKRWPALERYAESGTRPIDNCYVPQ